MLPQDLLNIIDSYVETFNSWECLPDPKSIRKLACRSNKDLTIRLAKHLSVPDHLMLSNEFTFAFQLSDENIELIEASVSESVMNCWQTSALFWLFIENENTLFHGCYTEIFENSLFYQLINILSLSPETITELGFLYLSKNQLSKEAGIFRLC